MDGYCDGGAGGNGNGNGNGDDGGGGGGGCSASGCCVLTNAREAATFQPTKPPSRKRFEHEDTSMCRYYKSRDINSACYSDAVSTSSNFHHELRRRGQSFHCALNMIRSECSECFSKFRKQNQINGG